MKCNAYECSNKGRYFYNDNGKIRALCGYCEFEPYYICIKVDWARYGEEENAVLEVILA